MKRTVGNEKWFSLDEKGFSLVEALVSMVILTFVLMGLMQAIIIAGEANTKNFLRENAIKIAQEKIEKVRTMARDTATGGGWDQIEAATTTKTITFKNITVTYTLIQTILPPAPPAPPASPVNSKTVGLQVKWQYRQPWYYYPTVSTPAYVVVTK
jgi:type IV pilus assembly protein PilV